MCVFQALRNNYIGQWITWQMVKVSKEVTLLNICYKFFIMNIMNTCLLFNNSERTSSSTSTYRCMHSNFKLISYNMNGQFICYDLFFNKYEINV